MTQITFKNLLTGDNFIKFQVVLDNSRYKNLSTYDRRKEPGFHIYKHLGFFLDQKINLEESKLNLSVYDCNMIVRRDFHCG